MVSELKHKITPLDQILGQLGLTHILLYYLSTSVLVFQMIIFQQISLQIHNLFSLSEVNFQSTVLDVTVLTILHKQY
jgi:hypothetical protein